LCFGIFDQTEGLKLVELLFTAYPEGVQNSVTNVETEEPPEELFLICQYPPIDELL
jgi:hypothetical protein